MAGQQDNERVCLGAIAGAHGVRGLVKIKPFTEDPADLTAYGPLSDEAGRRQFNPQLLSRSKDLWIARLDGVADREAAAALARTRLYIDKSALPAIDEEDAYYHADLVGLTAVDGQGTVIGTVRAVFDFGGGDVLEIEPAPGGQAAGGQAGGGALMVPFTRQTVPEVDVKAGRLVIEPGEEIIADGGEE